jgi:mannose-6-phosphate isomerase
MLYPLTFSPLLKERIWGGRKLESLYHKALPADLLVGESWEISDRPGDSSVVDQGPLQGRDLHWLMQNHGEALLGWKPAPEERFPLLIKILDAREKLSLQVHPPAQKAAALGGEPKTEMWYIAQAEPEAELYVGLRRGVTPQLFRQMTEEGTVADCFHRVAVKAGDAMFLPSGRVHAIGAGLVIFEIQQNSDTTYRVFDWNRVGPDSRPRALHITESMASIDFTDFEPALVGSPVPDEVGGSNRLLVDDPLFKVRVLDFEPASSVFELAAKAASIVGVVEGTVTVRSTNGSVALSAGQFCLVPACLENSVIAASGASKVLIAEPGHP